MRNCPGGPPKSARNRYVVVALVSRTIWTSGTTSNLGMRDPDRLRHGGEAGFLEEQSHLRRNRPEDRQAFRDDCRPDLDGARPGHDVLQRVSAGANAADADHGDVDLVTDVVYGAHADRTDRGTTEAAETVR